MNPTDLSAALDLLSQLMIQGQRISTIVRTATAEGRTKLTDEEKAAVKGDLNDAIARLERAVG